MKAWNHFRTVVRHRRLVRRACFKLGLYRQGLTHDLSKYSFCEFSRGCRYYTGTCSPNDLERRARGYSAAWLHHKGRNRHHFEYWNDLNPATRRYEPVKMPLRFVAEMFCDRIAASKVYLGEKYTDASPLAYYRGGNAAKAMHPETAAFLENLLTRLAREGEAAAFAYLRARLREKREY